MTSSAWRAAASSKLKKLLKMDKRKSHYDVLLGNKGLL